MHGSADDSALALPHRRRPAVILGGLTALLASLLLAGVARSP